MSLTHNQENVIVKILNGVSQREASKKAYPHTKMSDAAVDVEASNMLNGTGKYKKNPKISLRYKELHDKAVAEAEEEGIIATKEILRELIAIAKAKATDYANIVQVPDHKDIKMVDFTPTEELTEQQKRAIASIKEGKFGIEVKTHDKIRAIELLGRHLGMWSDKLEITGMESEKSKLEDLIQQMRGDG